MSQLTDTHRFLKQTIPVMAVFGLLMIFLPGNIRGDINEGFNGFDTGTRPAGWTFTGCNLNTDTYITTGNYGAASPSIKLAVTDDQIVTETFATLDLLTFWVKGQSTDITSALMVEEYASGSWTQVTNLIPLPTTGITIGPLTINSLSTVARFTYTKSSGNLAFDDVALYDTPVPITPTPTTTATATATPTATPTTTPTPHAVIDQVYPSGDENYVMLYNPGPQFNLQSYKLNVYYSAGDYTFTVADIMPEAGYYLVGSFESINNVHPDSMWDLRLINKSDGGNSYVQFLDPDDNEIDAFGWADPPIPDFFETTACGRDLASGKAWSRTNHVDTENNLDDFSQIDPARADSGIPNWYIETIVPDYDYTSLYNSTAKSGWNKPAWPCYYCNIDEIPWVDTDYIQSPQGIGKISLRRFGFSNPLRPSAYWQKVALGVHVRGRIEGQNLDDGDIHYFTDFNSASSVTANWTVSTELTNDWSLMQRGVDIGEGFFSQTELDNFGFTVADFKKKYVDEKEWKRITQLYILVHTVGDPTPSVTPTPVGFQTPNPSPSVTPSPPPEGDPYNPSFEYSPELTGWSELGTASAIGWSEDTAYHGVKSCLFQNPTTDYDARGVRSVFVPIGAGVRYSFSGWFYVTESTGGAAEDTHFSFRVEWWDSEWGYLSDQPVTGFTLTSFNEWQKRAYAYTAPAQASYATLQIRCYEDTPNDNWAYIDMFNIKSAGDSFFSIW